MSEVIKMILTFMGFPGSSVGKESTCNAGDPSLIPGSGRSTGEVIGYPLQYSWAFLVAQLVKHLTAMQETWVRSWLGRHWRRERLPTPVFWPGEFHGLYSPWGCKESESQQLSLYNFILRTVLGTKDSKWGISHWLKKLLLKAWTSVVAA